MSFNLSRNLQFYANPWITIHNIALVRTSSKRFSLIHAIAHKTETRPITIYFIHPYKAFPKRRRIQMQGNRPFLRIGIANLMQSKIIIYKGILPFQKDGFHCAHYLMNPIVLVRVAVENVLFFIDAPLHHAHPASIAGMIVDGEDLLGFQQRRRTVKV